MSIFVLMHDVTIRSTEQNSNTPSSVRPSATMRPIRRSKSPMTFQVRRQLAFHAGPGIPCIRFFLAKDDGDDNFTQARTSLLVTLLQPIP